jgi:hypothetical protein
MRSAQRKLRCKRAKKTYELQNHNNVPLETSRENVARGKVHLASTDSPDNRFCLLSMINMSRHPAQVGSKRTYHVVGHRGFTIAEQAQALMFT